MLSERSHWLTYGCAVLYALLGIVLFAAPEAMSTHFAWKVSAFITMTMGGWCIGTAWCAFSAARNWQWQVNNPSLIYLWLFGFSETLVLILFRDKLSLEHPIAWLYVLALGLTVITGVSGVLDIFQKRPALKDPDEATIGVIYIALIVIFVVFVAFLAIYGLGVTMGDRGTNGEIFPEIMSAFTLRSFGAFYLSLALGSIPLLITRSKQSMLQHGIASYALIVFITLAAVRYVGLFDFGEHRLGLLYWGAYIGVGAVVGIVLVINRKKVKVW